MAEATDVMRRGREVAGGGFWIRRLASPEEVARRPQRLVRPGDNKENVPPPGYVGPSPMRRRMKKSPLPEWHPRTPLRDITAIINALERRRLRVQAAARAAEVNRNRDALPENPVPVTPSSLDRAPIGIVPCDSSSSPVEQPLPSPSTSSSISEADSFPTNKQRTEAEEKLCKSIEKIEKIVKKNNMKKAVKEASAKRVMQRRTLMSMR